MGKYIVKRIALGLLSIFIVATLTFLLMNLVPGGPFVAEKSISKAAQEALAAKYGLDKPFLQRYTTYMSDFLHGDMGLSLRQRGRTVSDIIFSKFPVSAGLAGIAVAVALIIGIPLGCLSAYNRGKFSDNFIIVLMTCGIAIPSFISSVLLLYTFGSQLKLLPTDRSSRCDLLHHAGNGSCHLSDGIHHTSYAFKLTRRHGTGLHPHGKGKRSFQFQDLVQACASQRHSAGHYLRRPHACKPHDRFVRCGKDLLDSGTRP